MNNNRKIKIKNNGKTVELKANPNLLPEGGYFTEISEVDVEFDIPTKYGLRDRINITYEIQEESGTAIYKKRDSIWYNEDENSRWNQFLDALYGEELPKSLDLQDWIGIPCWIRIGHQESGNKTYANIVEWNFAVEYEDDGDIPFDDADGE